MRMPNVPELKLALAAAIVGLACGGGCTSLETPKFSADSFKKVFEKKDAVVAPESVAVVWTTAVLEKEAARPTRGFGGMVTFYETDNKKPVRVKGELTVYAYENGIGDPEKSKPDRKYVFTTEQLDKRCGEGPIGPAYNIWIPWDEANGPRREVGLIVRFDPAEGKTVMAKPTHNVLPGQDKKKSEVVATSFNETAGFTRLPPVDAASEPPVAGGTKMQTATFALPRRGSGTVAGK